MAAVLLPALAAAIVLAGPTSDCSRAEAKQAVVASTLPERWKDAVRGEFGPNEGIGRLFCADLTRDSRRDMVMTFSSGGTAGDVAWAVFRRTAAGGLRLALARLRVYKVRVSLASADVVEHQPVYNREDANCCPTGGYDHVRFHWNGTRFAVVRKWHTKSPTR